MSNEVSARTDDAPPTTAKHHRVDVAGENVPEAQGSQATAQTVTINRPVAEVYARFRDFARLGDFMENVERIDVLDQQRSHWVVKAPAGRTVEWDARITEEEPERLIAWTSEEGAEVPNSGRVTFRDVGDRGTVVTATLLYDPPGGTLGKIVAKLFQREPAIQARRDLKRFKQLLETGEIATNVITREQLEEEGR
ncbi:SRPBCC family protein [Sphingomonas jatrophae]|uniref:Polyketide cyclase / dehydrase and lipid transport n=1 Tax=Sphingomonas jatrophae TaxID=1166337 RepID=A0A1I6K706_9SPHN|nr:SRPBCC family protein [Sphingomonas jatrophae]SFR87009.1 Polyketide cyclase / dehydrase and lipid transport [Sphingomonas jatrophae]